MNRTAQQSRVDSGRGEQYGRFYVFGGIFGAVFTLIFIVAFVLIIARLVQGIGTWHKNNQSPKQTVFAVLVGKRTAVWGHSGTNTVGSTNTAYFLTFRRRAGSARSSMWTAESTVCRPKVTADS